MNLWLEKYSHYITATILTIAYFVLTDYTTVNTLLIDVSLFVILIMFITIAIFSFIIVKYKHAITGGFPIFMKSMDNKENPHFKLLIGYTDITLRLMISTLISCVILASYVQAIVPYVVWVLMFNMALTSWIKLSMIHLKLVRLLLFKKLGFKE